MLSAWKTRLRRKVLRLCVRWPRLADLYYCVNPAFRMEHRAAIAGKLGHEGAGSGGAIFTLRRNTHRLEKGLIMRPRREVFARDYIGETVECYRAAFAGGSAAWNGDAEARTRLHGWSTGVLERYFELVGTDEVVDRARARFREAAEPSAVGGRVPYRRELDALGIAIEDLEALAWRRRSVRWFEQRPVPREVIDRAFAVASLCPSACNRQPFHFRFFDDPELIAAVGPIPGGTAGFHQNFPCLCVVVGQLRAYPTERDRHVIYIDASLASMAFLFALEVQGVASCCINWPNVAYKHEQMRRAIGLADDEQVVMLIALGYPDPDGLVPYSQKRSPDELRSYNRIC